MTGKVLHTVLFTLFVFCLSSTWMTVKIEGRYDSSVLKSSNDLLKLEDGRVWQSYDDKKSWKKLGFYSCKKGYVFFEFENSFMTETVKTYPTAVGFYIPDDEREKLNLENKYLFTKSFF